MYGNTPPMYGQPPPPMYGPPPPGYRAQSHPYPYPYHREPSCCYQCFCCFCCFIFSCLIITISTVLLLYILLKPQIPDYKIDEFSVTKFNVGLDKTIETELALTIKAENPNTKLSLSYGKGNEFTLSYENTVISMGKIPSFIHGCDNATKIKVQLSGKTQMGQNQVDSFQKNEQQGKIPFQYEVKVPVSIIVCSMHLKEFTVQVDGNVTVDSIKPDKSPKILSISYEYKVDKFMEL